MKKLNEILKTNNVPYKTIISLILSVLGTLALKCTIKFDVSDITTKYVYPDFSIVDILIFVGLLCGIYLLISLLCYYSPKISKLFFNEKQKFDKKTWIIVAIIIFLMWLPYLLAFYPCIYSTDFLVSKGQYYLSTFTDQQPFVYNLYVGMFLWLGDLIKNQQFAMFLYSLVQCIAMAFGLSYAVTWLKSKGLKTIPFVIMIMFFGLFPNFPIYNVTTIKDPLFSLGLMLFSIHLYEACITKGKLPPSRIFILILSFFIIVFFRNNGIYIAVVTCVFILRKKYWKVLVGFAVVLLLYFGIHGPLFDYLYVPSNKVEALAIPLQQISQVVVRKGDDAFTDEDLEAFENYITTDRVKMYYTPYLADSIKWADGFNTSHFENNTKQFIMLWLKMMPSNFDIYVKAYVQDTFGFYHPFLDNNFGKYNDDVHKDTNIDLIEKYTGVSMQDTLKSFKPYFGAGLMFWIMMIFSAVNKNKLKKLIIFLPSFLCWGTVMVATPVAFSLRYVLVLMLMLPIYILIPFENTDDINQTDDSSVSIKQI